MLGDRAVLGVVDEALGADEVEVAVPVGVAAGEQQAALGPHEGDGGPQHERPDVLVAGRAEPLRALGLLAQLRAQVAGEAAVAQPRALQRRRGRAAAAGARGARRRRRRGRGGERRAGQHADRTRSGGGGHPAVLPGRGRATPGGGARLGGAAEAAAAAPLDATGAGAAAAVSGSGSSSPPSASGGEVARKEPATAAPRDRAATAWPRSRGARTASTDGRPAPASASAVMTAIRTALYSQPFSVTQGPLGPCTLRIAVIIVAEIAVVATGVSAPRVRSSPPPSSATPAAVAWRLPGFRPRADSKKPPVPSRPWPPKAPKSFCAPCPMKRGPMVARTSSLPRSMPRGSPGGRQAMRTPRRAPLRDARSAGDG